MITKDQIDNLVKNTDLSNKREQLFKLFDFKDTEYFWEKDSKDYFITYQDKEVYRESVQHVEAVAKLIRIPYEIWLLWANLVLISGKNEPIKLPLVVRLKIFKKAFEEAILPYLFTKDFTPKFEIEGCVNCGSKAFTKPLTRFVSGREFFVTICKKCTLGVRYPRPKKDELSKIYSEEYFAGDTTERGYFDYESEAGWRVEKAIHYLNKLEEVTNINPRKTKVLDLGSGYGYFLKALEDKGYASIGAELAPEAVEFANQHYKATTLEGELESLVKSGKVKENSFGLVTLWDVIEHFYDINDDMSVIERLLTRGGYIALRTNNLFSIEFEVFGKYFHSIKYEHTFYYSPESLKTFFAKFGLKEIKTWTHTHLFLAFVTKEELDEINRTNRGGDIFFVGQKN